MRAKPFLLKVFFLILFINYISFFVYADDSDFTILDRFNRSEGFVVGFSEDGANWTDTDSSGVINISLDRVLIIPSPGDDVTLSINKTGATSGNITWEWAWNTTGTNGDTYLDAGDGVGGSDSPSVMCATIYRSSTTNYQYYDGSFNDFPNTKPFGSKQWDILRITIDLGANIYWVWAKSEADAGFSEMTNGGLGCRQGGDPALGNYWRVQSGSGNGDVNWIENFSKWDGGPDDKPAFDLPPAAIFEMTAKSNYSGGAINTYTATIWNSTNEYTNSTSSGLIRFPQTTGIFNINVTTSTHFNITLNNYNLSNNLDVSLYQAILNITAREIISNITITDFNATLPLQTAFSINNAVRLYVDSGVYNLSGASLNYWDASLIDINISALETKQETLEFGYVNFSVVARDIFSNATLHNWTINVTALNYTWDNNYSVENNLSIVLINGSYQLYIDVKDYAIDNTNVSLSQIFENYTFYLYPTNSLSIQIYDEDFGTLILQDVALTIDGGGYYNVSTAYNGTYEVSGLPSGSRLKITASSSGYNPRDYYVTLAERSHRNLEIRLANASSSNSRIITVIDNLNQKIGNVTIEICRQQNGTCVDVGTYFTDSAGAVTAFLSGSSTYELIFSKPGYQTKNWELTPSSSTYTVILTETTSPFIDVNSLFSYVFLPVITYLESYNTSFNISLSDPDGVINFFGLTIHYNASACAPSCTINETSGGNSVNVHVDINNTMNNVLIAETWFKPSGYDLITFNVSYALGQKVTPENGSIIKVFDDYGSSVPGWQKLIGASFGIAVGTLTAAQYIAPALLPGVGFFMLIAFTIVGWVSVWITAIVITIGALLWLYYR